MNAAQMPRPALPPPPPLHTSAPGSFAHDTLRVRIPAILADTRARLGALPDEIAAALDALDGELRSGSLRLLDHPAPDRAFWDQAARAFVGRSWLDLPWFFAETYFYRRLLEATGYFGPGAWAGRDPFAPQKADELHPDEGPRRFREALESAPAAPADRLRALFLASLWGNRVDLSYDVARQLGSFTGSSADLLVDDTAAVATRLLGAPARRVVIIADNTGTELLMDLALCQHMLDGCGVARIDLHLKAHPMFVSDALPPDVGHALAAVGDHPVATRLSALIAEDRLRLTAHPFYNTCLFYPELWPDLRADLGGADLVITKGDANYRRLVSDAPWPPETPFADVVRSFPAPLLALRTLKAETVVGLPEGLAPRLAAQDPRWMVNGRRAVAQAWLG